MTALRSLLAILISSLSLVTVVSGQSTSFMDWSIGISTDKTVAYAATINRTSQVIAKRCTFSTKDCSWHISAKESCEQGESYAALVNTDKGAGHVTLICDGQIDSGGDYRFTFSDWKTIENLALAGTRIGVAIPLQSDNFIVYRFSLVGAKASTERLEAAFLKLIDEKPKDRVKI